MKYKMIKNNRFSFYAIDNPWDIRGGRDGGGLAKSGEVKIYKFSIRATL